METKKNNKDKYFYLVYGISFIFLLIVSESVYIYGHDLHFLRKFFLSRTTSFAAKNDSYAALNNLFRAARLRFNQQLISYDIFTKNDLSSNKDIIVNSNYDKSIYLDYLRSLNVNQIFETGDVDFLRIFYNLALLASKNDYQNDILPFLKIASYMEPDLSHIHIEIANYYLLNGNFDLAKEQIQECMNFKNPYKHCDSYRLDSLEKQETFDVGFLKEGIDSQYE